MSRIFFYFLQSSTKRSSELRYKIFILIWKRRVNKIPFFVCSPCVCVCVYMYNTMLRYRNSCVQDERIFRIRLKIWRKFCSRKYSIKLILFILRRTINRTSFHYAEIVKNHDCKNKSMKRRDVSFTRRGYISYAFVENIRFRYSCAIWRRRMQSSINWKWG